MPPELVFIHIGKTAGTSLRKMLEARFGPGSCSPPFVQSYLTADEASDLGRFPIICGHISRADQQRWFPTRPVISVLREPIDRAFSFLHYVRSLPPDSSTIAADAARLSIAELIETPEAQRNLHNTMVRQLGGHMLDEPTDLSTLLERAEATLREALWVGRQQAFGADVQRLSAILGVPLEIARVNLTPHRKGLDEEDPALVRRLRDLAAYDLELWAGIDGN